MIVEIGVSYNHHRLRGQSTVLDRYRFTARSHVRQILAMILLSSRRLTPRSSLFLPVLCPLYLTVVLPMEFYADTLELAQFLLLGLLTSSSYSPTLLNLISWMIFGPLLLLMIVKSGTRQWLSVKSSEPSRWIRLRWWIYDQMGASAKHVAWCDADRIASISDGSK